MLVSGNQNKIAIFAISKIITRKNALLCYNVDVTTMEIKNGKKNLITGETICFIVGILSAIVCCYWLFRALVYDDTHIPEILLSMNIALFLVLYAAKR